MSTATKTVERSEGRQGLASMIRRVKIRNYKSIKNCDVELGPFTILVGRNGSGKSNFLDAIRLVTEGLRDQGLQDSFRLSPWSSVADEEGSFDTATIALYLDLDLGAEAKYEVTLGLLEASYGIVEESLTVWEKGAIKNHYRCVHGRVTESSTGFMPPVSPNRLYLGRASDAPEFRPAHDALAASAFYNLVPEMMRKPEEISTRRLLARDGSNITSNYGHLESKAPGVRDQLLAYFSQVVPEFEHVRSRVYGPQSLLVFERAVAALFTRTAASADLGPRSFYASGMSDGTLRALGILVAINQLANDGRPIRLVGIEEPETALHPAAVGILMSAFREAATHTQILVTTHSADLLDEFDPDEDHLLAVESRDGRTEIGPVNRASREAIRERLYSAGELLRMDYFEPERPDITPQGQTSFGPGGQP